ncbi:hypothetical protein [Helicobacter acinonychis]|uniref:hypothetical protein n=1 Tax=Helicobacter acinonychis TaxID=212 RepID=UPI00349F852A
MIIKKNRIIRKLEKIKKIKKKPFNFFKNPRYRDFIAQIKSKQESDEELLERLETICLNGRL